MSSNREEEMDVKDEQAMAHPVTYSTVVQRNEPALEMHRGMQIVSKAKRTEK